MNEENNVIPFYKKEVAQVCGDCEYPDFSVVKDSEQGYLVVCDNCSSLMGTMTPWECE